MRHLSMPNVSSTGSCSAREDACLLRVAVLLPLRGKVWPPGKGNDKGKADGISLAQNTKLHAALAIAIAEGDPNVAAKRLDVLIDAVEAFTRGTLGRP